MTIAELQEIARNAESQRLELISGTPSSETVGRVVGAFLNADGGRVLIGVSEAGQVVGVREADRFAAKLKEELRETISPRALWTVEIIPVDGKSVVLVEVPAGLDKPYISGGGIFHRNGNRIVAATKDWISKLIVARSEEGPRWERQIVTGAEHADLDWELVRETVRMARESERWQGGADSSEQFLHALRLLTANGVTNAAILLFGINPQRFIPQARVRLLEAAQGKTGEQYAHDQLFEGPLVRIAAEIPKAFTRLFGAVQTEFSDSWERNEQPRYPPTALREGVMNALAHRDYAMSGTITILITSRQMTIANPGRLPNELSTADLKKEHSSMPRNPDIAHVLFLRKLIEKVGRGTQRIVEDCKRARLKEPKWIVTAGETRLVFFSRPAGVNRVSVEQLSDRQQAILAHVRQNAPTKLKDLWTSLGGTVTERTIRSDLQALVEARLLMKRGQGRNTSYATVE
jgi:ATP-dependent DNA helicase RecG